MFTAFDSKQDAATNKKKKKQRVRKAKKWWNKTSKQQENSLRDLQIFKKKSNSQCQQSFQFGERSTCRLPCLEEQLLVLLEGDNIFWGAPKFFSSLMIQYYLFHMSSLRTSLKGNLENVLEDSSEKHWTHSLPKCNPVAWSVSHGTPKREKKNKKPSYQMLSLVVIL